MICDSEEQRVSSEQARSVLLLVPPRDKWALIGFTRVLLGEMRQMKRGDTSKKHKKYKRGCFVLPCSMDAFQLFNFINEDEYLKLIPARVGPLALHLPS